MITLSILLRRGVKQQLDRPKPFSWQFTASRRIYHSLYFVINALDKPNPSSQQSICLSKCRDLLIDAAALR